MSIQNISKILILALALTGFISCDDDDSVPFEVKGDVYLLTRLENDDLVFAMTYYAYGTQGMNTAKVTSPESETIDLEALSNNKKIYAIEPTLADFLMEPGVEGNYVFDVIYEDIAYQSTDEVRYDIIDIPIIDTTYFDNFNQVLAIEWTPDGTANNYKVRMTELDGELVFESRLLGGAVPQYVIDANEGSWFKYVDVGKDYIVELHAVLYEPSANNDDYLYNIQEISIGTQEAVWGE